VVPELEMPLIFIQEGSINEDLPTLTLIVEGLLSERKLPDKNESK